MGGSLGFIPLVTFGLLSKVGPPKIVQESAFQHEKLEKHVRSCARSRLRAKPGWGCVCGGGGVNLESNSFVQAFL